MSGRVSRWLNRFAWRKPPLRKGGEAVARRREPKTEGEKALWEAMGWNGES